MKLRRSLLDEAVFLDERLFRLLIWCKLRANHTPLRFHGELINVGEFVTSMERAGEALGCAKSTVWRGLEKLASPEMGYLRLRLVQNAKRKFTVVTVIEQTVSEMTEDTTRNESETVAERERNGDETGAKQSRETKNQRTRESKDSPPAKAPRVREYPADFEQFWGVYPRRVGKDAAARVWESVQKRLQAQRLQERAEVTAYLVDRATVYAGTPAGQAGRFTPHPSTWLSTGRYADDESEWRRNDDDGAGAGGRGRGGDSPARFRDKSFADQLAAELAACPAGGA